MGGRGAEMRTEIKLKTIKPLSSFFSAVILMTGLISYKIPPHLFFSSSFPPPKREIASLALKKGSQCELKEE